MYLVTIDHDYSVTFNDFYKAFHAYDAAKEFANRIGVDATLVDLSTGELIAWNDDEE